METAQRAVLFVDVTDSTRIYESLGDTRAHALINRLLEERVTRIAFGDSAWVRRSVPEDQQLVTALDFLKKGRNQRELLAMAAREQGSSH